MSLSIHQREYLAYSNFIGGLLEAGLMDQSTANIELVQGFWEAERRDAADAGFDIDAQLANIRAGASTAPVATAQPYGFAHAVRS